MTSTPKPARFLSFAGAAAPDRPRLYCFPFAGGTASMFASWARTLSPEIAVFGVELAGHGSRFSEDKPESVQEMAATVVAALLSLQDTTSVAFYGHSLGALVALETARLLAVAGTGSHLEERMRLRPLVHLFVGAARAPHHPAVTPLIHGLPQREFLDAVQHRYGGLPAVLFEEPELLELVLPVLRADFRAYEQYLFWPNPRLQVPVTGFHGTRDGIATAESMQGWSDVTPKEFQSYPIEGDHFFLNTGSDVVLRRIRQCLRGTQGGTQGSAPSTSQFFPDREATTRV